MGWPTPLGRKSPRSPRAASAFRSIRTTFERASQPLGDVRGETPRVLGDSALARHTPLFAPQQSLREVTINYLPIENSMAVVLPAHVGHQPHEAASASGTSRLPHCHLSTYGPLATIPHDKRTLPRRPPGNARNPPFGKGLHLGNPYRAITSFPVFLEPHARTATEIRCPVRCRMHTTRGATTPPSSKGTRSGMPLVETHACGRLTTCRQRVM